MRKIFFSLLLLLNFQTIQAQSIEWSEGSVVLSNGVVLAGKISVEIQHDLILFQQEEGSSVYQAHQIMALYFYDEPAKINRRFVSLKDEDRLRPSFKLYEVVVSGEAMVLRRKKKFAFPKQTDPLDYNYFTWYRNILGPLAKFSNSVLPELIIATDGELKRSITKNRLKLHDAGSAIRIIQLYNRLDKRENFVSR